MITAFIHGFLLAFGLILPLGVQNIFIFNQGAAQPKFRWVIPVILVASLADTLLISLAVLGVSVVVLTISWFKTVLVVGGVIFLGYMGWLTWGSPVDSSLEESSSEGVSEDQGGKEKSKTLWTLRKRIIFTLSVSLLNPHAILDTIGIIGTSSLSYTGYAKATFTLACIVVSWLWFLSLGLLERIVGRADTTGKFRRVLNKVSAVVMWASGVYLVVSLW
jgi:L-lysine exporter family protein LysE/ArgO